jgi:hypothetical protein
VLPNTNTTTTVTIPRASPTASDRRTSPGEASSGRTVGAIRGNDSSNNKNSEQNRASPH